MKYTLDGGKFPRINYNRVVRVSRQRLVNDRSPVSIMTLQDAKGIYNLTQNLNGIGEPQLALKKRGML